MRTVGLLINAGRCLAALLFLGFLVEQAPHSVHHLFDPGYTAEECPFATAGERLPGLGAEAIGFDHGPAWEPVGPPPALPRLREILLRSPFARAPPRFASLLA